MTLAEVYPSRCFTDDNYLHEQQQQSRNGVISDSSSYSFIKTRRLTALRL